MSLSNLVENEMVQDFVVRHPILYLAMSTASGGEDGSTIAEPVGSGYIRQMVTAYSVSGNQLVLDEAVSFPQSTGSWGTLTHGAVYDAETGGNYLGDAEVVSTDCPANTVITVPQGTAILSMD